MRIVVAVGGSALPGLSPGEDVDTAQRLAQLGSLLSGAAIGHELVVVVGSSPQQSRLALQMVPEHEAAEHEAAEHEAAESCADVIDHHVADVVCRDLERAIALQLAHLAPGRAAVNVTTSVIVGLDDPAFARPGSGVGPVVGPARARSLALRHGWEFAGSGPSWRRVVPAPVPRAITPLGPVLQLLALGHVVLCEGAGGAPVRTGPQGLERVDAVVDADAASALLARQLGADLLVLATDVDGVYAEWATPRARLLPALEERSDPEAHAMGSMRPKVRAAQEFARTGRPAVIGSIDDLADMVVGRAGTLVIPSPAAGIVDAARREAPTALASVRRLRR